VRAAAGKDKRISFRANQNPGVSCNDDGDKARRTQILKNEWRNHPAFLVFIAMVQRQKKQAANLG